ncbi:MAG: hypothetical protein ABWZ40_14940 [Caulobacterales bacterium]
MIRILVIAPLYLAMMFLIPLLPGYKAFELNLLQEVLRLRWHMALYGLLLLTAVVFGALIQFRVLPYSYRFAGIMGIVKMGFVGAIIACLYQGYAFYNGGGVSLLVMLTPFLFMIAEAIYELVVFLIVRARLRRHKAALAK